MFSIVGLLAASPSFLTSVPLPDNNDVIWAEFTRCVRRRPLVTIVSAAARYPATGVLVNVA